jgi:hypothetical protein
MVGEMGEYTSSFTFWNKAIISSLLLFVFGVVRVTELAPEALDPKASTSQQGLALHMPLNSAIQKLGRLQAFATEQFNVMLVTPDGRPGQYHM